jgi:CRISPR-associated endonuclease/helicase Cas3
MVYEGGCSRVSASMPKGSVADEAAHRCIFWGKFSEEGPRCLPLAAHCLDVAIVFRALCDVDGIRRALSYTSGETLTDQQLDRLAVLGMNHDVGKANLAFQYKVFDPKAPRAGHIRELAPLLDLEALDESLHMAFVEALSYDMFSWFPDEEVAYSYLLAAFSHHGRPLIFQGRKTGTYFQAREKWWRRQGPWEPMAAIAEIMNWARRAFPEAFQPGGRPLPADARFHHRFAGLVMLADWLGSHSFWFPIQQVSFDERLRHDREIAPRLMRAVGLDVTDLRPVLADGPQDFQGRFGFVPYPLQAAVDALDPKDEGTRLVIAESETGSGKTEAALNWFFTLFAAGKVDGLYFALPTRVAARELYRRVLRTMENWFPDSNMRPVTVLAVPGYAQVDGSTLEKALPDDETANRWQDDRELQYRDRCWAAERPKRFLAATVAVGTVDQALLSTVQTAHAHLRSVCLDRSLLVVDEVHASDLYMSRLLAGLLEHHLAVGGRAMLLSATLGARARHSYVHRGVDQKEPPDLATAQAIPYPAVTLADGVTRTTGPLQGEAKRVRFELLPVAFAPEKVVDRVAAALASGARVLMVLNTVSRANTLLRVFEGHPAIDAEWLFRCNGVICPHHGRFAPADREVLDSTVSTRLGRDSPPGPILLIGTQTLEQSLDIDADLLITDLAPADVLLQRVGRLHRHLRRRPVGYEIPRCLVLVPEEGLESALDGRGYVSGAYMRIGYGSVYDDLRTLELTKRMLTEYPEVSIPRDNRRFVEAVTHPECLASLGGERWTRHGQNVEGGELAKAIAAGHAAAVFNKAFGDPTLEFNEAGGKVAVRLGAASLQLRVDSPFMSPFGRSVEQIVIPGHMAPSVPAETVSVLQEVESTARLLCGDRHYVYGRFGLEEEVST